MSDECSDTVADNASTAVGYDDETSTFALGNETAVVSDGAGANYTVERTTALAGRANETVRSETTLQALLENATDAAPAELLAVPNETDAANGSFDAGDPTQPPVDPGGDLGLPPVRNQPEDQQDSGPFGGLSGQSRNGMHAGQPDVPDPSAEASGGQSAENIGGADATESNDGYRASGERSGAVSADGEAAARLSSDGGSAPAADADRSQTASFRWLRLEGVFVAVPSLLVALLVVLLHPLVGGVSALTTVAFEWLSRIGVVLRYSRRDDSDPLDHETRADIYDVLVSEPGTTLPALSDRLETPLSTVRYHVRVLKRERLVSSQKQRGNRRFYPVGVENEALAAALRTGTTAEIIRSLADRGAATVGDLVDDIEKSYGTVSHHVSRLVEDDVLVREKEGRRRICRLTPGARTALSDDREPRPEATTSGATAD